MNLSPQQKQEIFTYIDQNRTLEAVKYLRENFGISLQEARVLVDQVSKERSDPARIYRSPGSGGQRTFSVPTISSIAKPMKFLYIFMLVGLVLTGLAVFFIIEVSDKTANWIETNGTVTGLQGGSGSGKAPVITYEYQSAIYNYQSTIYSNPPSYDVGEEVTIYINPEEPYDILIGSFTEKWLLPLIFGLMGVMFLVIPAVVYRATSS